MIASAPLVLLALSCQGGDPGRAQPPQPLQPMPVPLAIACRRGDKPIEIDGSLVDWPELPALDLTDRRQLSGTAQGAWHGPADLSAFAFLLWDDEALYFACAVKDEWHRALDPKTLLLQEIPVADSVVLSFDPARNTRALGPDPGRADDVEFWLADEPAHELLLWDRLRGSARIVQSGRQVVSHDREQGITTYEARLPFAEILPLGQKAAAGTVFDLQVVVNDFDESTDPMPQTRIGWTFGCGPVVDPCLFGSVMLVADVGGFGGHMPEFPPKPATADDPAADRRRWQQLATDLARNPPAVHDGKEAPGEAGGIARLRLLEQLDDGIARFPRVDYVEFCCRIHRRMVREVAGTSARGLPWFWDQELQAVSKAAAEPVPDQALRIFRVPQNGWLVRGPGELGFLVDAAGANLQDWLWGGARFVVLTQPLDMTRRNDQLLIRMAASKSERPFLTHIAFHLPWVKMSDMPLVEPGQTYGQALGVQVHALGSKRADGSVPFALGYRIETGGGPSLLIAGPALRPDEVPRVHCTAMLLSPRNPLAIEVARAADVELVLVDDAFACASLPNVPRVTLANAHAFQKALLPLPSLLLAPGESWDVRLRQ